MGFSSNRKEKNKIFTFLLVFSQLASTFKSPVSFLDMGEVTLIVAFLYLFLSGCLMECKIRLFDSGSNMLLLFLLFVLITGIDGMTVLAFSNYQVVIRVIRWFFIIIILILANTFFDFDYGKKLIYIFSGISALVLVIQIITFKMTRIILCIPFQGRTLGCSVESINTGSGLKRIYRFSSVFREPSQMAYFVTLAIVLLLFDAYEGEQNDRYKIVFAGVFSCALFLTTSSYACLLLAITWGWFFILWWKDHMIITPICFLAGIALCFVLTWLWKSDGIWWEYLKHKLNHMGSTNRTSFFSRYLPYLENHAWLGVGVGNEEYYLQKQCGIESFWLNAVSMTFFYCGYLGVMALVIFYLFRTIITPGRYQVLVLLCISMTLFSGDFYGKYLILYFVVSDYLRRYFYEKTELL